MPKRPTLTDLFQRLTNTSNAEHSDSKEFLKLTEALEAVTKLSSTYQNENKDYLKHHQEILKTYRTLDMACEKYLKGKGNHRKSDLGNARLLLVNNIKTLVGCDIDAITNTKAKEYASFSELIDAGRRTVYDISNKDMSKVEGNLSSRIRIQDKEKNLNGFFTPQTKVRTLAEEHAKLLDQECDKLEKQGKADYSEAIRELNKHKDSSGDSLLMGSDLYYSFLLSDYRNKVKECFSTRKNGYQIDYLNYEEQIQDALNKSNNDKIKDLMEKDDFRTTLYDIVLKSCLEKNKDSILDLGEIKKGQNVERRNVAMSEVAKLLGCPDLLAHSKTMTLKRGENEIPGVFMENAPGYDVGVSSWLEENKDKFSKDTSFDSPDVFRQLADLQALDYICGNIDRHKGNMFYEFEKGQDGSATTIKKITGIDNDCSFGLINKNIDEVSLKMVRPENFVFMSKKTTEIIDHMTKEMLQYSLANLISEEEIDKAWERTEYLQNLLRDKKKTADFTDKASLNEASHAITILKDEDWKQLSLSDLEVITEKRLKKSSYYREYSLFDIFPKMEYDVKQSVAEYQEEMNKQPEDQKNDLKELLETQFLSNDYEKLPDDIKNEITDIVDNSINNKMRKKLLDKFEKELIKEGKSEEDIKKLRNEAISKEKIIEEKNKEITEEKIIEEKNKEMKKLYIWKKNRLDKLSLTELKTEWDKQIGSKKGEKKANQEESEPNQKNDATPEKLNYDQFIKDHRYEMIFDADGNPHGINYLKVMKKDEAFFRLSKDGASLEKYSLKESEDNRFLQKEETGEKAFEEQTVDDLCAANMIVGNMLKELVDVDPTFMRSSQEFRDLKRSVIDLSCDMEKFGKEENQMDPELLKLRMLDVSKKAENYLNFKQSQQKYGESIKESTKKRMDAAKAIQTGIQRLANANISQGEHTMNSREVGQMEDYIFSLGISTEKSKALCSSMRTIYQAKQEGESKASLKDIAKTILISHQRSRKPSEKAKDPKLVVNAILDEKGEYKTIQEKLVDKLQKEESIQNQLATSKNGVNKPSSDIHRTFLSSKLSDRLCNEVLKEYTASKKEKMLAADLVQTEQRGKNI